MAQIGPVTLQITPNPTNINLLDFTVNYNIFFNAFDVTTNLIYRKVYVVIGVDTPPDPATAGGNDTLATFTNFGTVRANGVAASPQNDTISVARATADEDNPPIPNPDELLVRVELQPLLPANTARNSNIVSINLP